MSLGYEGHVKIGSTYALGTGASVPRGLNRIESSAAYGGTIDGSDRAIGLPRQYDWEIYDGSVSVEMTAGLFTELKTWLGGRQDARNIFFAPRYDAAQEFDTAYFNSISISAGEGGAVNGSVGFVAIDRADYQYGDKYIDNKDGDGFLCSGGSFPSPLNAAPSNTQPVPYWNTSLSFAGTSYEFLNWSLDISQDVVKFFSCEGNVNPVEPKYIAVGPMTIVLSGAYMADFGSSPLGFLGDTVASAVLNIGGVSLSMTKLEATTEGDDVQTGDAMVPLNVEYAVYHLTI